MDDGSCFLYLGDNASGQELAVLFCQHMNGPFFFGVQGIHMDAAADVGPAGFCDFT